MHATRRSWAIRRRGERASAALGTGQKASSCEVAAAPLMRSRLLHIGRAPSGDRVFLGGGDLSTKSIEDRQRLGLASNKKRPNSPKIGLQPLAVAEEARG
jgi:hypothetical protein